MNINSVIPFLVDQRAIDALNQNNSNLAADAYNAILEEKQPVADGFQKKSEMAVVAVYQYLLNKEGKKSVDAGIGLPVRIACDDAEVKATINRCLIL